MELWIYFLEIWYLCGYLAARLYMQNPAPVFSRVIDFCFCMFLGPMAIIPLWYEMKREEKNSAL